MSRWVVFPPGTMTHPLFYEDSLDALSGDGLTVVGTLDPGLRLHPDGDDPHAFRINLPGFGSGSTPVVFNREPGGQVTALHLGVLPLTFHNRPGIQNPRPWAAGALAAGATALAVSRRHRQKRAR